MFLFSNWEDNLANLWIRLNSPSIKAWSLKNTFESIFFTKNQVFALFSKYLVILTYSRYYYVKN